MKRLRPARCSGQLLRACPATRQPFVNAIRCLHAEAPAHNGDRLAFEPDAKPGRPSTSHKRPDVSAKLAALHARLALSKTIPLQTLARALITPSADPDAEANNSNLAYLGSTIVNYHVLEYLVCKWPRLPMAILYEALRAYAGHESLQQVARQWGLELAAAPGQEVDPGLLQWKADGQHMLSTRWGYIRPDVRRNAHYHRPSLSSRVVLDVDFGERVPPSSGEEEYQGLQSEATASFVQAVVGSIYTHCGREPAKSFVASHILSRQLDPSALFAFKLPTRELALLCAREGFEAPLARLESETGRLSRTPVYVVGIYSGSEKLGEGSGPSLDIARRKASMNALKAWYLYSPGNKVRVPSDTMDEEAEPWTAPHIDIGEII
ncbi:ribonuclease III [Hirsutella rhossiliensis]|uniref:Large ribosomal subunit protein mL44 n=1 Tax=Hirsutella rhossiliensis TaxID=111463 RepID=A0A9P8SK87_9HYPO|nr:Ribonuclease III [Hirsutella rhossiliensis]KAH0964505.1 Ribonuclease III [Hirsutella rhossiliensis]